MRRAVPKFLRLLLHIGLLRCQLLQCVDSIFKRIVREFRSDALQLFNRRREARRRLLTFSGTQLRLLLLHPLRRLLHLLASLLHRLSRLPEALCLRALSAALHLFQLLRHLLRLLRQLSLLLAILLHLTR